MSAEDLGGYAVSDEDLASSLGEGWRPIGGGVLVRLLDPSETAEEIASVLEEVRESAEHAARVAKHGLPGEYGREYRHTLVAIHAAAVRAAQGGHPAEQIGARPSDVGLAVEAVLTAADELGLSGTQLGAWLIAAGYVLAGGETVPQDEYEGLIDSAAAAWEEAVARAEEDETAGDQSGADGGS